MATQSTTMETSISIARSLALFMSSFMNSGARKWERKLRGETKDEGLENRNEKNRGTKSKVLNLIAKGKKEGHSSKNLVSVPVKMISLFSATNPLLTWSPSSTPARTSCSQTHRWFCTSSRTTNALSFHIPFSLTCSRLTQKPNAHAATTLQVKGSSSDSKKEEQEEEYKVLTAMKSQYNDILIVDTPKTRMLLLDSTHNVHSLLYKDGQKWTRSYWDEFASLPAIIPQGPVAIFGLGGGTAAHLMLDVWPSLQLEGWEIDEILINKARDYFGLSDLEKQTQAGGILHVVVGDALCYLEDDSRKYAGIVIDLFSGGKVLPQLQDVATWLELKGRLIPNGRLMVNCGGIEESDAINERISTKSVDNAWVENPTIKVLCEAFPGQVSWKRMPEGEGANYLALTGPLPDLTSWSAMVPHHLSANVSKWRPCSPLT
uniref:PABS domain-containing protein n=1 Tax=Salix viminalis TaxID=40686 RepID=A0A6N2M937_SALVM